MTPTTGDRLTSVWTDSLAPYGAPPDALAGALADLRDRHREPHRRYHTLEHLDEMLAAVDRLAADTHELALVRLAVCFHDAVYDARSSTNEVDSATLATATLAPLGVPDERSRAVADLVRTTAGHQSTAGDAGVLADADLWILGSPPERYRRYALDVRREYAHVDDEAWCTGRMAVLDDFLGRPRLYVTERFHADLDARARHNLAGERRSLLG